MTTVEERVSRLEGGYEHLATRTDVVELKSDFVTLKAEVQLLKWGMGLTILLVGGVLAAVLVT